MISADVTNANLLDQSYSNFRVLGIGKPSEKQIKRKEKRQEKRALAKEERQKLGAFGRVWNVGMKVNPATAIPRSSALLAIRLNIFGLARRLYPAILNEAEIKAKNIEPENAKRANELLKNKIIPFWIKLGGRSSSLIDSIRKGYDKPILNTKKMKAMKAQETKSSGVNGMIYQLEVVKPVVESDYNFKNSEIDLGLNDNYSNVTGVEEAGVAAYISAGLPIVTAMITVVANGKLAKNPYNKSSNSYSGVESDINKAQSEGSLDTPSVNESELKKIADAATEDAKKGIVNSGEDDKLANDAEKDSEKILGIPKTWFWVGVGVIGFGLLATTVYMLKKKK